MRHSGLLCDGVSGVRAMLADAGGVRRETLQAACARMRAELWRPEAAGEAPRPRAAEWGAAIC